MIDMCRSGIKSAFQGAVEHPGLLFSRGLPHWNEDPTRRGAEFAKFVQRIAAQPAPAIYYRAYERWRNLVVNASRFACWCGRVDGRLFLGLGGAHVLETNLTINRTYGVPLIPGSSLKGLAHAHTDTLGIDKGVGEVLFGKVSDKPEENDAGYLIFHDAGWIPGSAETPFAQEVVTVHHPDYYTTQGNQSPTDFDSPNPNVQLAARGSFLFVVEGLECWAKRGLDILMDALQKQGLGGKVAAGYGYFVHDEQQQKVLNKLIQVYSLITLPLEEQLHSEVQSWSESKLADLFGRDFNKTNKKYGEDFATLLAIVREIYGDLLKSWEDQPKDSNKYKAYKKILG